jgi:hypothetical protein
MEMRDFGDYEGFCRDADRLQQITERIGPAILDVQKALRDPKFADWGSLKPFVQQQLVYIKLATPLRAALETYEATALTLAQRLARDAHKKHLAFLAQSLAAKLRLLDGFVHPDNFLFKSLPDLAKKATLAAGAAETGTTPQKRTDPETPRPAVRLAYHNVTPQPEATDPARRKPGDPAGGETGTARPSPLSVVTSQPHGAPDDDAG